MHKNRATQEEVHSILDFPEALAGIIKTLKMTIRMIEEEMNSATDNPLVYYKQDRVEEDKLVSAGNFHGEYVAKASDFLGFALFELGKFSDARIQKYINGKVSRLPPYLIKDGGLNSGMMIVQCKSSIIQTQVLLCFHRAKFWSSRHLLIRLSLLQARKIMFRWEGLLPENVRCFFTIYPIFWVLNC